MAADLPNHIQELLHKDLCVIPLKPGTKQAAVNWKEFQARRPTDQELAAWFTGENPPGAAIVTGPISGIVVIDPDDDEQLGAVRAEGLASPTYVVTGSGNHHFYFSDPGDGDALPAFIFPRGVRVELKRRGHYVVAPGSKHPETGKAYEMSGPWPPPPLPSKIITMIAGAGEAARERSAPLPEEMPDGGRNNTLFVQGCRMRRLGHTEQEINAALQQINKDRGRPPLPSRDVERIAAQAARYEPAEDLHPYTDSGNAERMAELFGDLLRYDHGRKAWFCFDGDHWRRDETGEVDRLGLDTIRERQRAALAVVAKRTDWDPKKKEATLKFVVASESAQHRGAIEKLARSVKAVATSGDEWDRDPWLLGVKNGVLDLRTGELRRGLAADMVTKVAPVEFKPNAKCERWEQFMREIFRQHPALPAYMQRVVGYALTGIVSEQAFWILSGTGSNGKSTFVETIYQHVLGGQDYAWTIPFPEEGWSASMGEYQKASLIGKRLVTSAEVNRRVGINEEIIKSLTGGDTVQGRHPYGRPCTFVPECKFFLRVNHAPKIKDDSHGMWRRVKLVPFEETFDVDPTLGPALAAEAPGILAWAVRGCLEWQRLAGLQEPGVVRSATEAYRQENDELAGFLAEECRLGPGLKAQAGPLYAAYKRWARNADEKDPLSRVRFGERLKKRFETDESNTRHTVYMGVGLLNPGYQGEI